MNSEEKGLDEVESSRKKIRILLDYIYGPIWKDVVTSEGLITGIEVIDNDIVLKALNDSTSEIYGSLYSFDKNEEPCTFDKERFSEVKKYLLILISAIKQRLNEINDGSYFIVDEESERLTNEKFIK